MRETTPPAAGSEEPAADPLDPPTAALGAAVVELARHVQEDDLAPVRWFALMRSALLLAQSPSMAQLLGEDLSRSVADDPLHLTSVEIESASASGDPLRSLEQLSWPSGIAGLAAAFRLGPQQWAQRTAEDGAGSSPGPAAGASDLQAIVAVLEDGTSF